MTDLTQRLRALAPEGLTACYVSDLKTIHEAADALDRAHALIGKMSLEPITAAQEISLLKSQLANCHAEIFKLRDQFLAHRPFFECPHCGGDLAATGHKPGCQ